MVGRALCSTSLSARTLGDVDAGFSGRTHARPQSSSRRRGPAPVCVARPDEKFVDPEADPNWYKKRPKRFDYWRSKWNPLVWDAESWFKTHTDPPWVEHTLKLREENNGGLPPRYEWPFEPERLPPVAPPVLSEHEIFVRRQVDKQREAEELAYQADMQTMGEFTKLHHALFRTDSRLIQARKTLPYTWRDDWTPEQEERMIGWNPEMEQGLKTGWQFAKPSARGLRPVGPDEVEYLAEIGRLVNDESELPMDVAEAPLSIQAAQEAQQKRRAAALAKEQAAAGAEGSATLNDDFPADGIDAELEKASWDLDQAVKEAPDIGDDFDDA